MPQELGSLTKLCNGKRLHWRRRKLDAPKDVEKEEDLLCSSHIFPDLRATVGEQDPMGTFPGLSDGVC